MTGSDTSIASKKDVPDDYLSAGLVCRGLPPEAELVESAPEFQQFFGLSVCQRLNKLWGLYCPTTAREGPEEILEFLRTEYVLPVFDLHDSTSADGGNVEALVTGRGRDKDAVRKWMREKVNTSGDLQKEDLDISDPTANYCVATPTGWKIITGYSIHVKNVPWKAQNIVNAFWSLFELDPRFKDVDPETHLKKLGNLEVTLFAHVHNPAPK